MLLKTTIVERYNTAMQQANSVGIHEKQMYQCHA